MKFASKLLVFAAVLFLATNLVVGDCELGTTSPDSSDCTKYFECIQKDGKNILMTQKCADGKKFEPNKKYCSSSYECPK